MSDYQKSFTVSNPASEVYAAITKHIADWWSNDLTGSAAQVGDKYTIAFGKTRKTMEITEAIPDKRMVWQCREAYIAMATLKDKSEWVGTKMIWTLAPAGDGTALHFLHEGLNRSFECYDVCEQGWDTFLASLQAYLVTGVGKPHKKAVAA